MDSTDAPHTLAGSADVVATGDHAEDAAAVSGKQLGYALLAERLVGRKNLRLIEDELAKLRDAYDHPNRTLRYDDVLVALLLAFYNPTARSLRTIEGLAAAGGYRAHLTVDHVCRSTFSDATRLFDPNLLTPLIADLQSRVPGLKRADAELAGIVRQLVAADGSYFSAYADVAWALIHAKRNGTRQAQVRLDLRIDADDWRPLGAGVSGDDGRSEGAALVADGLLAGVIYLLDRNFVEFDVLRAVIGVGSDFVVRCRANAPSFAADEERDLGQRDVEHGVLSDRLGHLPGSGGGDTPEPPPQRLREVRIANEAEPDKPVRLLTTLLDVPAYVIGLLYRKRWQVELFFRWLKCWANVDHLIAHSRNGVLLQFYAAVIAVLLVHVRHGRRPSRYAYQMLHLVAAGAADMDDLGRVLARRERERDLERARLARKRAAARAAAAAKKPA